MSYFEPNATLEARLGKIIGDTVAGFLVLCVIVLIVTSVLR
jgi:hypothetical protein